jgi:hypothetical protein
VKVFLVGAAIAAFVGVLTDAPLPELLLCSLLFGAFCKANATRWDTS